MAPVWVSACLWALAASAVAFLPLRSQYAPGLALLLAAPLLIGWLVVETGWIAGALVVAAFVSMFRRPLGHLADRIIGVRG